LNPPAETVNHHLTGAGEFSTGRMGIFQPVLTSEADLHATPWKRTREIIFWRPPVPNLEIRHASDQSGPIWLNSERPFRTTPQEPSSRSF
jgi:hypothetical protein